MSVERDDFPNNLFCVPPKVFTSEQTTHNDMLRTSLVSGFQTPRNSCSKLDMRATPDPVSINRNNQQSGTDLPSRVFNGSYRSVT